MTDFTPINTQEEFNERIADRLRREREKAIKETEAKFSNYEELSQRDSLLSREVEEKDARIKEQSEIISKNAEEIATLTERVKKHETDSVKTKTALEFGIPLELADRISGDDEEAIRQDAEKIASLFTHTTKAPIGGAELPIGGDEKSDALKGMLKAMKGE